MERSKKDAGGGAIGNPPRTIPPSRPVGEILVAKSLARIHGLTESHELASASCLALWCADVLAVTTGGRWPRRSSADYLYAYDISGDTPWKTSVPPSEIADGAESTVLVRLGVPPADTPVLWVKRSCFMQDVAG